MIPRRARRPRVPGWVLGEGWPEGEDERQAVRAKAHAWAARSGYSTRELALARHRWRQREAWLGRLPVERPPEATTPGKTP